MNRRSLLKNLALAAACPLCTRGASASEGSHWSYKGEGGPAHWGLDTNSAVCGAGAQQSPIDITGTTKAILPPLEITWPKAPATVTNNGHTIQVTPASGGMLKIGDTKYELVQFHFHAPSEHLVDGKRYPMEVHFVHKDLSDASLGVLGAFIAEGVSHPTFSQVAAHFPTEPEGKTPLAEFDAMAFLPATLGYWKYEGSLTTPPCSEVVDWILLQKPIEVDAADIRKFTRLYDDNARPVAKRNRRYVIGT